MIPVGKSSVLGETIRETREVGIEDEEEGAEEDVEVGKVDSKVLVGGRSRVGRKVIGTGGILYPSMLAFLHH
jgi:hypothetical protein